MRAITILTFLCASVAAHAADAFDLKVANIDVLQDKNVQAEIGITPGQLKTMNVYAAQYTAQNKAKVDEYQKAKKQIDKAFTDFHTSQYIGLRTNVLKTLSPNQIKRLRELTLQAAGPRALLDKAVADKVGIPTPAYSNFCTAIREGDQKIAAIKQKVSDAVKAKYKNQKPPKTKKESDDLRAKVNADLAAEMKKHEGELANILKTSEAKTSQIISKKYLDSLKALMGKKYEAPKKKGK
jgi:hypothetical protein